MYDLTHARHDPAHCLAPGLFRGLKRGDYKKQKLDVRYEYGKDEWIHFAGFEPLGAPELRLLQGIVAMAGPSDLLLDLDNPKSDLGKQLSLFLDPRFEAIKDDARVVKSSLWKLMHEIGYSSDDKKSRASVMDSIRRLSAVSIFIRKGKKECGFHLLSYLTDETDGKLLIALNPRITGAVIGLRPYARIELCETRALSSDSARLIHQRLCGFIDPGKMHKSDIRIETLSEYVWPEEAGASAMRDRMATVRKAMKEIESLGWTATETIRGKFKIGRPPVAKVSP